MDYIFFGKFTKITLKKIKAIFQLDTLQKLPQIFWFIVQSTHTRMLILQLLNQNAGLTEVFVKVMTVYISVRYKVRAYVEFERFLSLNQILLIVRLSFVQIQIRTTRIFLLFDME